ncbi:hybrid sensor histidine kinase/response regulator [Roseomonas xinghualingensis]|uniref:hybrid sensor histidine kinase/response regulator n=1 Tax=Roseomonas xinghualingensis TaxID=2986475 RepID=UPI0021F21BF7|nr:PAS-domain containing protein [Roseomonas sp. SXEYE001]MCV4209564.1 PAS-domain containing protein [Roseomonas sp. SXEYE001]
MPFSRYPKILPSGSAGLWIVLGTVGLLAVQAIGALTIVREGERAAIHYAQEAVEAAAESAASSMNRSFLAVDSALAGLPNLLSSAMPSGAEEAPATRSAALSRVLMGLSDSSLGFRDLILLPVEGGSPIAAALAGSRRRPPPVPHSALLAPPQASGAGRGGVSIAGPVPNPATGEWAIFLARPISLPGLTPVLAVAEMPVPVVASGLTGYGVRGDMVGLRVMLIHGEDRVLLASAPHDESRIGRPVARPLAEGVDPGHFTGLWRTLYPSLHVVATQDAEVALRDWRQNEARILYASGGLAFLTIAISALLLAMLRQRDMAEAERARGRQLLESSIEAMSDGFVMWDDQDRLIVCNERYRDFYKASGPAIRPGATLTEIMRYGAEHGQYPQAGADKAAFVAEAVEHYRHPWNTAPVERLLPDGRWILVTERRVPGGGSVGIRTDITQQKRAAADLAEARDQAAAAGAAKSRFLARMSHELRTPLNGVLGMAQVLANDPTLSAEQQAQAAMLEEAGRHLLAVANDVLDLAHVEAGRMPLRRVPTALVSLLQTCCDLTRSAAVARRITLDFEHDPALPSGLLIDPMRLRQLLLNLLSNAVKFTPEGGRVKLRALPQEGTGKPRLRLEVLDTGPGIPMEQRDAVFRDFVRLDRAGTEPSVEGFGLGLAIATGIVEAMGGRIGLDDNPETQALGATGARFWVELPLEAAGVPAPALVAPAPPKGHRLRVLVVDDVATNRLVARALLERAGHLAELATGGAEAIEAVSRAARGGQPFDLVLMDLAMPGMDGLEATRRLRALLPEDGGRVPVVALTAGVFDSDNAACRDAGMTGYLAKPVTMEALNGELARITPASMEKRAEASAE